MLAAWHLGLSQGEESCYRVAGDVAARRIGPIASERLLLKTCVLCWRRAGEETSEAAAGELSRDLLYPGPD